MREKNGVAVRIGNKGRVIVPKRMREALGLEIGDTVFLQCDTKYNQLHLAPAINPFDIIAKQAMNEYKEGYTRTLEEYTKENDISLE